MGEEKEMKCYKGFDPYMKCRDKKYEENTVYEESGGDICGKGMMHYCKNPFYVWDFYSPVNEYGEFNQFAEVEPLAEEKTDDGKKFATSKLKICAKLSFGGFVKAAVDFVLKKTSVEDTENMLSDNGDRRKQIGSSGYSAQIGSSGDYAKIGSSGDYAKIGSSGDSAQIGCSGDYAKIGSSGYSAQITSTGEDSVICCTGFESVVSAKKGSWITLSEWEYNEEKRRYVPICVKTEYVDGDRIKEDVRYILKGGEFVEY